MDEFIRQMMRGADTGGAFEMWEVFAALALSAFLSLLVAYLYRETHRGLSYTVGFVHTMVIMGTTVSLVMLIIGSNIARAFALVGALSIIRFRNAVKDSRDVAFIFVTMAIGMATGVGFYLAAVIFTLFMIALIYMMNRLDVGAVQKQEIMIRIVIPGETDYRTLLKDVFLHLTREHSLLSIEGLEDDRKEVVFSVELKRSVTEDELLVEVSDKLPEGQVTVITGYDTAML